MYRKTRVFSEMLVSGIRGNLLGFGFLNTILELVFASYGWNVWKFHFNCKLILEKFFRGGVFRQKNNNKKT